VAEGGIRGPGGDVVELVVAYARQETVGPLRGLGRFVAFGVVGAVFMAVGISVLLLAGLRVLQTETGTTFTGNLSWVPYLIVGTAAAVVAAFAGWRIARGPAARRLGKGQS
jgi:hypothetical protein